MASHFARSSFARFRATSVSARSRVFLGLAGSLGLYYASTRRIHADSGNVPVIEKIKVDLESPALFGAGVVREFTGSNPGKGVHRVDGVIWPANFPCEDAVAHAHEEHMGWSFWSIYDGHVGPQTASVLESLLLGNLAQALSALYRDGKLPETESIHSTFKRVFLALDDEMVVKPAQLIFELPEGAPIKTLAAVALQAARAGSCALVSFYEANVRRLHVAVVGDSRAVLGRRRETADGKTVYDVHVLSVDQTGRNPAEAARLAAAHPDEALVTGSRVLGWGISRSFGNGVMKWSRELQTTMQERVLGDKPRTTLLTPPYFTAEPEMTTTAIEPGDFMVMGSDGLWDCLSNEEVVGLVGVWLARRDRDRDAGGAPSIIGEEEVMKRADSEEVIERVDLPVELKDNKTHYATWNVKKRFVNVDTNAAAHLARNALGGADTDLHHALLTLPAPRARYFRDDLSAIVVFFE